MKILHVLNSKGWGGGTAGTENLFEEMSLLAPDVTNILLCVDKNLHNKLRASHYKIITAPAAVNLDPRFILKLIQVCRSEKIDLLHLHGPNSLTSAVVADKFSNLPPFIFSKKTAFPIKGRKRTVFKYNYQKLKKIICISKKVVEVTKERIEDERRITLIYDGISLRGMNDQTPFLIRNRYNIPEKTRIIGNIGNHIKAKDLHILIDTLAYLVHVKKEKNLHFFQMGSFTEQTPLFVKKVKELGLDAYITFTGFVPQASNFIPQFNIFCLTSKSEGGPMVVYEAVYHEVPVVATDVGAVSEILEDGKSGFIAPVGDFKKLALSIHELLKNPEIGENFAPIAKQKLIPKFTAKQTAVEILEEYRQIVNDRQNAN